MVGIGYDLHILSDGRKLIIGGIEITSKLGTVAHSDGDVLIHSLIDALLGAASLGDIGEYFPDTDYQFQNIDSQILLSRTLDLIYKKNLGITNIDAVIILENPKISNYKLLIKNNIARICNISPDNVNIKAKTNEKLGYLGNSEGIACYCICELYKI